MMLVQSLRQLLNGNSFLLLFVALVFIQCKTTKHVTKTTTRPDVESPVSRPKVDTVKWSVPDNSEVIEVDPAVVVGVPENNSLLMEHKLAVTFVRIHSDTTHNIIQKDEKLESVLSESEEAKVKGLFDEAVKGKGAMAQIQLKALSPNEHPVVITKPEFMRRMMEMQAMSGNQGFGNFPESYNVVVNTNHPLIADKLLKMEQEDKKTEFVDYLYNLALLNQNMLKGANLSNFINRSLSNLAG